MGQPVDLMGRCHIIRGLLGISHVRQVWKGVEDGRLFAVMWALWLRCNEVIFQGRMVLVDEVVHNVVSLVSWWFRWVCMGEGESSVITLYFG